VGMTRREALALTAAGAAASESVRTQPWLRWGRIEQSVTYICEGRYCATEHGRSYSPFFIRVYAAYSAWLQEGY
jgi:hypothetical protein